MPVPGSLGERIERLRKRRKLSKNKLNSRVGFSAGYISRLTSATDVRESPRSNTLEVLAAALEASFDYLARGAHDEDLPLPVDWGFSRREIAMRALVARGHSIERVLVAGVGVGSAVARGLELAPATWWLEALEAELSAPGSGKELVRGKVGIVLGAEPDALLRAAPGPTAQEPQPPLETQLRPAHLTNEDRSTASNSRWFAIRKLTELDGFEPGRAAEIVGKLAPYEIAKADGWRVYELARLAAKAAVAPKVEVHASVPAAGVEAVEKIAAKHGLKHAPDPSGRPSTKRR